jgi:Integrase core domain
VGRKRVERLMRQQGLRGRAPRRYRATTDSEHTLPVAPNVVERDFEVTAPNEVWVTDVTSVATRDGWLFLAVRLDLFSRCVVGWATSARNDTSLALQALRTAVRVRQPPRGLLHHSDRGSPYASDAYRAELAAHGIARSMSRCGDCWDNAVAESFFSTLKRELVPEVGYPSRARAHEAIADLSLPRGSPALCVNHAARRTRRRSRSKFARPYICRFTSFKRVICPSDCALLQDVVRAARSASPSCWRPAAKVWTEAMSQCCVSSSHRSMASH